MIQLISLALAFLLLVAILLFRNHFYKKKTNLRLARQNKEINDLNENLEQLIRRRTLELQNAMKRLQKRNKDLDHFAHIISHHLRAPVAQILGLQNLFNRNNPSDASNLEIFAHLGKSTRQMDSVIKDLNKILVIKDSVILQKETIEISQVVEVTKHLFHPDLEQSDVVIEADLSQAESIFSVRSYLESIIFHLVDNAIKYRSSRRGLIIQIKSEIEDNLLSLTVTDNGVGIPLPEQLLHQIFEPYKRMNIETEGKGIGLYLVKSQVEALHGKIEVFNEKGKGCTFKVLLPLNDQDEVIIEQIQKQLTHD